MKKLSLLKPDKKTRYLGYGKGDEVNYIEIPKGLGIKQLEEDVKSGATHFNELLEVAKKRPSRVVVIDCTNEEQGLMAATYLAGVYNEADKVAPEDYGSYGRGYLEKSLYGINLRRNIRLFWQRFLDQRVLFILIRMATS